ncbi:hypothetical protein [Gelidibacter maritimus]|uniref:Orphan protein n=1 Tax=Gelidibacter maritimus TaxID=2761487 RepID=A0A7W2R2C1_9FLAO|nr:hypothetical protein [Gelidibacter maritimus]MBA6151453.1 hypothetical protein [Gelidibacter maritimus]
MKKLKIILIVLLISSINASSQGISEALDKALPQMLKGEYRGTFLNDSLVATFIQEYLLEAQKRNLELKEHLDEINWILIEPEQRSGKPRLLTGMNLGWVDREHKLILLSESCLLDRYILKSTLYRELSHYLGLSYDIEGLEIMSLVKPKGYSYAWFDDYEMEQIVYDDLFAELKKMLN